MRDVSGGLHAHDESCRQSQAVCTRAHENGGTSQAVCMPTMKIADSLRLSAPALTKMAGRLRRFHAMMKIAESLRLSALFVHAAHQNSETSQAVYTPNDENCRPSQALSAPLSRKMRTSQALCAPMMKIADSFRLSALSLHSTHDNRGTSQAACMPDAPP